MIWRGGAYERALAMGAIKTAEIKAMSITERLDLIERIWDTLVETPDQLPVPGWHVEELERRLSEVETDARAGSSWADVKRRITGKP
jgi:putative addiction module component (TIGR02574 family)